MNSKIIFIAGSLTVFYLWENLLPYYKKSGYPVIHDISNITIALTNGALMSFFSFYTIARLLDYVSVFKIGIYYILPLSVIINSLLVFILMDMWMYWWHRFNHRVKFLWLFHRAHHSDLTMNTTTMFRFHPGELIISTFLRIPVFIILGIPFEILFIHEILLNMTGIFHHSNIRFSKWIDRVLRIFIVTPEMHRVHHSNKWDELNTNYSSFLSFWDRIFKTYLIHKESSSIIQGLPIFRARQWQNLAGILKTPFAKRGIND